ncbi:hypothetical protein R5R35_012996 [Gryllus longicercus]|uniref:Tetraspanin n=1 Tax=Gryllus longicercus TaxID=2509291 RepID=A0AAN9YWY4_9ORTH
MGCATSLVKYLVFIFNFVFALAGLGLLVIGILLEKQVNEYDEFLNGKFHAPPIILIVVGSLIFIVAFFGCCGAIRESHCMLIMYVILVLTVFILQVVVAGLAFAYRDDTKDVIDSKLKNYVFNYGNNKAIVDSIQTNLKCCGYEGTGDYTSQSVNIPSSCCPKLPTTCARKEAYDEGCKDALEDFIESQGNIIGGVAIGIAVIEIVGIIFGLCLANSIKNAERRGR